MKIQFNVFHPLCVTVNGNELQVGTNVVSGELRKRRTTSKCSAVALFLAAVAEILIIVHRT